MYASRHQTFSFPSEVAWPLLGGRHCHNGLSACWPAWLSRDGPSGLMSPRPTCAPLAQCPPNPVTTLSRILRYPARRGRLPRVLKRAKTCVSSALENFPMCKTNSITHTHTWSAETSPYKLRRTPGTFLAVSARAISSDNLVCAVESRSCRPFSWENTGWLPLNVTISPQLAEQHCPVRRSREDDGVFPGCKLCNIDGALVAR